MHEQMYECSTPDCDHPCDIEYEYCSSCRMKSFGVSTSCSEGKMEEQNEEDMYRRSICHEKGLEETSHVECECSSCQKAREQMNEENTIELEKLLGEGKEKFRPINSHKFKSHTMKVVGEVEDGVFAIIDNKDAQQGTAHFFAYGEKVLSDKVEEKITSFKKKMRNCLDYQDKVTRHKESKHNPERKKMYEDERDGLKERMIEMYKQALEK